MPLELKAINTIRTLAIDAIQKANSGHPGAPMGLAPLAYLLWTEFMRYNPRNPDWPNRDRFVLSAGHASMLQYACLHLAGFDLALDDLKNFRQWNSRTPGHPEAGHTPGVETTTGPLGQGLATAVGLALAEANAASTYNVDSLSIVDHHTYVIASDGDLMEGLSHEAASLAGHLGLGKLICFYDDNRITIDGPTNLTFSEDIPKRFEAYGWQVFTLTNINNLDELRQTTKRALSDPSRPSLIVVKSQIGYGSPNKAGKSSSHGSPLGEQEVQLTKKALGWPTDSSFLVPDDVAQQMSAISKGEQHEAHWRETFNSYGQQNPLLAGEFERRFAQNLPQSWKDGLPDFEPAGPLATRKASQTILGALMERLPELIGGSADLAGSNGTKLPQFDVIEPGDHSGRIVHFGIREHAMAAICSGLTLHGDFRAFCATFLIFTDYMRPAIRLAALMKQPVIYVMTHDSIGLGEDGPTHQPIEHLAALRAIPNLHVVRPADANEVKQAWIYAIERQAGPTVLVFTRQKIPILDQSKFGSASNLHRGAYVVSDTINSTMDLVIIATGSELSLALDAQSSLEEYGISCRVVSMPCVEAFLKQGQGYQQEILPNHIPRLVIEAASPFGWHRFTKPHGQIIAIEKFGASAPGEVLMEKYGFNLDHIVNTARNLLNIIVHPQ